MRFVRWIVMKRHVAYAVGLLVGGGLLLSNSLTERQTSAQTADSLYVAPASGTYTVGSNFTVSVRENSSAAVNVAEANLSYSSNLEFVAIDGTGSGFGIDASSSGGGGSVSISRGANPPVTGDQLVAKVTFKVLAAGAGSVQMLGSSALYSASTSQDVANSRNGGNYSLQAAATPPPAAPAPSPTPASAPTPAAKPAPAAKATAQAAVTITPQGNAQATPLPGESKVELSAPATLETTGTVTKQVAKVEYLINGKVVSVDTTPPYSQLIDTKHIRNGTYKLTSKTYYKDGSIDASQSSLVVANPFSLRQLLLQIRHYAWLVVIVLIIVAELVYRKLFKAKKDASQTNGSAPLVFGGGTGGAAANPPSVTIPTSSEIHPDTTLRP